MTEGKVRQQWVDIARGLGIILVVYAHAARGLVLSEILPDTGWPIIADTIIYAFHMPLFFVLAGLHIERGAARGRKAFLLNKLQTIAWPYFLWSYIEGGIKLAGARFAHNPIHPEELIAIPIAPIEHFWFLYVLFFCQLLIAFVLPRRWLLVGLTLAAMLVWFLVPNGSIAFRILHFLPYVVVGLFAEPLLARLNERPRVQWMLAAGAWLMFALLVFPAQNPDQPDHLIYGLALLGSAGAIALSMRLQGESDIAGGIAWLGRLSMPIYLLHTLFSVAARSVLPMFGLADPVALLVLVTLTGLVFPILVYQAAAATGITRLLGFGPPLNPRR